MPQNQIHAIAVQNLFKSVIARAVMDAFFTRSKNTSLYTQYDKQHAIDWLCGKHMKDLRLVCELAGVSADRIVKVSKEYFESEDGQQEKIRKSSVLFKGLGIK
jgi:hypothetical protein